MKATSKKYSDEDEEPPILLDLDESPSGDRWKPVPVTILTGFLGSGKTTLVKYILNSPDHGKRIAVIENEFAPGAESQSLSVEGMIARDGTSDEFSPLADLIELPNGCICCTVKDSLVTTLEALVAKQYELDYILIECSGMANPGPIASVFWLDEALESRLQLDGIVTLVDSKYLLMQLEDTGLASGGGGEAAQQIAYADRIVLNKVDLVDSATLELVKQTIKSLNLSAPILQTNYSQIPNLTWIMDTQSFDVSKARDVEESFLSSLPNYSHCQDGCTHDHDHSHTPTGAHTHTSAITNLVLTQEGSISLKSFRSWLAHILWTDQDADNKVLDTKLKQALAGHQSNSVDNIRVESNSMKIMRLKGILSVEYTVDDSKDMEALHYEDANSDLPEIVSFTGLDKRKYTVQAVHDLWDVQPCQTLVWSQETDRNCQLVIIGRFLDREMLKKGFQACFKT